MNAAHGMVIAGDPSGLRRASEQVSDVTLGGVRQTAIPKNDSAALELASGRHLNAPPLPSIDPDRLTCSVRVLAVFPSPPRGDFGEESRSRSRLNVLSSGLRSRLVDAAA